MKVVFLLLDGNLLGAEDVRELSFLINGRVIAIEWGIKCTGLCLGVFGIPSEVDIAFPIVAIVC